MQTSKTGVQIMILQRSGGIFISAVAWLHVISIFTLALSFLGESSPLYHTSLMSLAFRFLKALDLEAKLDRP